jgi:hypothetical protein
MQGTTLDVLCCCEQQYQLAAVGGGFPRTILYNVSVGSSHVVLVVNEAVFVASFHSCFMYESKQTDEVKSRETKL